MLLTLDPIVNVNVAGPLRVLAFVLVLCPLTGSPFLWRIPR